MREVKVTCDCCGADITDTGSTPAYRLRLTAEKLPHTSGLIHAVVVRPPIDRDYYFCNKECLRKWAVPKWKCPSCGEEVEDGYHLCPNGPPAHPVTSPDQVRW